VVVPADERFPDGPRDPVRNYLVPSNPRLLRLIEEYRTIPCGMHSMWETWPDRVDLQNFRRDGDYLGQLENTDAAKYRKTFDYVAAADRCDYLIRFREDELFGVVSFEIGGRPITRDLLDSVLEISFLRRVLGLMRSDEVKVLDVGAGYGRFAHRFTAAFPSSYVYCVDAVPQSTFLCEFYTQFREFSKRARAVSLGRLDEIPAGIDLAVNIHSWSECTLESINFWLDRIVALGTRYLFVVPHTAEGLSMERDRSGICFWPTIEAHGFDLVTTAPKYVRMEDQDGGIFPSSYFLFERRKV